MTSETHLFQFEQMKTQHLNRLNHQTVELWVRDVERLFLSDLLREHLNVLIEGLGGADVAGDAWFTGRTSGQFAFLEDEGEQRKERVTVNGILVAFAVTISHSTHGVVGHDVVSLIVMQAGAVVHVAHGPGHGVVGLHRRRVVG